jgi:2-acylglycerol O-acyltransferase 2
MFLGCLANPDLYRVNPGITFLVSSVLHKAPYWNILEQLLGQFGSADKASMTETMRRGADIALIPGGFEEASLYQHGRHKLYLRDRAGFIKMALQHGYDIVPMYTFGEEKSYYNLPGLESLRLALNRWQIPGVVPIGKFGLMPFSDHRMDVFFASPLRLPHIASPTREDVAKWHGEYLKRIAEVFDAGKDIAGQPDAVLEVF